MLATSLENPALDITDEFGASTAVLKRHGKTFYFAGKFLGKKALNRSAQLYAFCRYVDDLVDDPDSHIDGAEALRSVRSDLRAGVSSLPPVREFIQLSKHCGLNLKVSDELLSGMEMDLGTVRMQDVGSLLRYCYRAAGTVGLHMQKLLGATAPQAAYHAVDLGVAMQLTNIARDVLEDAQNNRMYLPTSLLGFDDPSRLIDPGYSSRRRIRETVQQVLELADRYYLSGEQGIRYLPKRSQAGIFLAARIYREIGVVLAERNYAVWEGRAYVSKTRKVRLAAQCLSARLWNRWTVQNHPIGHDRLLHRALHGLPGCNGGYFRAHEGRL
jgi:phytoene synthase